MGLHFGVQVVKGLVGPASGGPFAWRKGLRTGTYILLGLLRRDNVGVRRGIFGWIGRILVGIGIGTRRKIGKVKRLRGGSIGIRIMVRR